MSFRVKFIESIIVNRGLSRVVSGWFSSDRCNQSRIKTMLPLKKGWRWFGRQGVKKKKKIHLMVAAFQFYKTAERDCAVLHRSRRRFVRFPFVFLSFISGEEECGDANVSMMCDRVWRSR